MATLATLGISGQEDLRLREPFSKYRSVLLLNLHYMKNFQICAICVEIFTSMKRNRAWNKCRVELRFQGWRKITRKTKNPAKPSSAWQGIFKAIA